MRVKTMLGAVLGAAGGFGARWWLSGRAEAAVLHRRMQGLERQVEAGAARVRDASARLQSIIDSAVDAIIVIDCRGRIESFNPGAERLFGYAAADVLGQDVTMLMNSPEREEHDRYISRYLHTGEPRIIGIGREVTGRRRDGTVFPLHLSVGEFQHGGERKFTGILHDLTRRVQAEQQLREGAALAKVGEMAAVIAHEVKNPLAGVRGALEVLSRRLPPESRDVEILKEIITRLDSLDGLIKDLLLFARPVRLRPAPVDLTTLVAAAADMLRQDPAVQAVSIEVEGDPTTIVADAGLLRIVFENLFLNAAQALGHRGRVRVVVSSTDARCTVAVSDDGPGIPEEIRDQVFLPFFTTKARGSGLGLATARRMVDVHGGEIGIESAPEAGTTVRVTLPRLPPSRQ
jgi:PAS domain S-box-containing protein